MLVELETMVDATPRGQERLQELAAASAKTDWADGFSQRWGSASGVLDLAAQSGFASSALRHLFVRLDGEAELYPLLKFVDDNQDSPGVIKQLFRAGLRSPVTVPICAGLARRIELVDFVLNPSTDPICYCGNRSDQKGFARCTRQGSPRAGRGSCLYCIGCLRFFSPRDGQVLGFVERCIVGSDGIACLCRHLVSKQPKPWARDRTAVECPHCGRQIHLNTGLIIGQTENQHS